MVEPQIVVLVVAGSSPVGHPKLIQDFTVPVAQPDRASDFGSEGWGFESLQARHFFGPCRRYVALILTSRHAQDRARLLFTHGLTEDYSPQSHRRFLRTFTKFDLAKGHRSADLI